MCKRRALLTMVIMLGTFVASCGRSPTELAHLSSIGSTSQEVAASTTSEGLHHTAQGFTIELGGEEDGLPGGTFGLTNVPDGHVSFIQTNRQVDVWLPAGVSAYLFRGPTLEQLTPHQVTPDGRPVPVLEPSGSGFDSDYAAFGAVLPGNGPDERLGVYHAEQCGRNNFTAAVGLARSTDGGVTWQRLGPIVTGQNLAARCEKITGAGQPSAVFSGDYIYLYYVDWSTGPGDQRPDQIYLARAPRARGDDPSTWEKYTRNGFGAPGLGGTADPVIRPPEPLTETHYAALPSVSFNTYLKQYLAVFETNTGFYYTVSADGIQWQPAQRLLAFPQAQSNRQPGSLWYSYPSLLSPTETSHLTTSQTGYLYYSRGVRDREPHHMVRRPFTIRPTPEKSSTP